MKRVGDDPVMVTDRFRRRVEKMGLNGFFFAKIWPLADDEQWEELKTWQRKADCQAARALNGQAITILLSTAGREATPEEEDHGLTLVATLSAQARQPAPSYLAIACLTALIGSATRKPTIGAT